jgi:hypothetical protein
MCDKNEETEVLVENDLSLIAQSASLEIEVNIKQNIDTRRTGLFRSEWLKEFNFPKEYT